MIKAPAWCAHAHPSARGWQDPVTGEVLKSAKHTLEQIAEWKAHHHGAPAPAPAPQTLHEAPVVEREITHAEAVWHHGETVHGHEEEVEVVRQASAPLHHSGEWDEE